MEEYETFMFEIQKQVIETEDEFIFRTLYPYCNDILETKISKETLKKALVHSKDLVPLQVELEADGYADGELVYDYGKCPKCGWQFEEGDKDWEEPYCCHCGQKLKWFETEEE